MILVLRTITLVLRLVLQVKLVIVRELMTKLLIVLTPLTETAVKSVK